MATYFIRQGGHGAQGPFEEARVRQYVAEGKVRAGMEISADGQRWTPVEEHRLYAAAAAPLAEPEPVEEVEVISAAPERPARRPTRRTRPAPASGGGGKAVLAVVGLLVVGAIAVMAAKGGSQDTEQTGPTHRTNATSQPVIEAPRPPLPALATKSEFRKRWEKYWEDHPDIGWRQPGIYGKTIDDAEAVLSAACSGRKPDRTQTIGGKHYWYFNCADGVVQLTWTYWGDTSGVRLNVDQLNDY